MGMGIVSDADFEKEVGRAIPIVHEGVVIEQERPGRNEGDNNVPDSLRKIIGETAVLDGRDEALELADGFGISPSSVSAYSKGAKSTATIDETPNKEFIEQSRTRVQNRARKILMQALGHITNDKLESEKPMVLAGIARQMSGIVKEQEPENPNDGKQPLAQFVIMCPPTRSEADYKIIKSKDGQ